MQVKDMKQKSVGVHDFAMNPRAEIMRSTFPIRQPLKTAFSAAYLVPICLYEVLPGDTFNVKCSVVARTAVPIVPILDNWHMEFFFFFTPNRICWSNWAKMLGEQTDPNDSIAYTVPTLQLPAGAPTVASLWDYLGLPTAGQIPGGNTITVNVLPARNYNRIYNEWFRDQNLQNSAVMRTGDSGDLYTDFNLLKRGKRHDYFTAALPWPQKGQSVTLPVGAQAPVKGIGLFEPAIQNNVTVKESGNTGTTQFTNAARIADTVTNSVWFNLTTGVSGTAFPNIYADLNAATGITVNTFRQYFQTQKFLERQARGGTRYTEVIQSHFGVRPPDFRLDRPEYIGGGKIPVLTNAIPQTSATGLTGGSTPAGNLAATGYANGSAGFNYSAQEHGYILGLVNVRADLTYSQGMARHWSRRTLYDFYFPVFAMLGEQAIYNKEIFCDGSANDDLVFGYIPRWDEYRHFPAQITGIMRPTATGNLAYWHSSQLFATLPTLNSTFITDNSDIVLQRNFAAAAATAGQQFLCDMMFTGRVARPLPMHSVPGLVDHF